MYVNIILVTQYIYYNLLGGTDIHPILECSTAFLSFVQSVSVALHCDDGTWEQPGSWCWLSNRQVFLVFPVVAVAWFSLFLQVDIPVKTLLILWLKVLY